ncbi:MAG: hypothetical protein L0I24_01770 [Pseudonocardia sp.]|nr:gamma-butyrolactone biosynthesis protein [Actinomycetes bacterium]MDN5929793.1 hypothetical protein [Pseudonocardia sp.]
MTVTDLLGVMDGGRPLTFLRTVDRSLLHREALSEVFLTDSVGLDERRYLGAAQLPSSHAYYTDHVGHRAVDPMLLLECCRQAETFGGHAHMGIDTDRKFILQSWSMRLPGLFSAIADGRAAELTMSVQTNRQAGSDVPVRALTYDITMSTVGGHVGDVQIAVGYLSSAAYAGFRSRRRGSRPPLSDEICTVSSTVGPTFVGRSNPANVLLAEIAVDAAELTAVVRPVFENCSMFDHPQDHLPGMVLTEAALQACLIAGRQWYGDGAETHSVVAFDLAFSAFAELDLATTVKVRPLGWPTGGDRRFAVSFHQDGATVVEGEMSTAEVPMPLRARSGPSS